MGQRPRVRQVAAGAVDRVMEEVARAKTRMRLPADAPVISCYEGPKDLADINALEAGQDN